MTQTKKRITKALNDEHLTRAVLKSTKLSVKKRDHLVSEMPDFEAVRSAARAVRQRSSDEKQQNYFSIRPIPDLHPIPIRGKMSP